MHVLSCHAADKTFVPQPNVNEMTPMKTVNWQTKALALFIAAAALCLAAACADEYTGPEIITPSTPCSPDAPLEPSEEFQQFVGLEHVYDLLRSDRKHRANRLRAERLEPETERIQAIVDAYIDQRERQSNRQMARHFSGYRVIGVKNEKGLLTDKQVIRITVSEEFDQGTLSPEDRIPECIEGTEVHLEIRRILRAL